MKQVTKIIAVFLSFCLIFFSCTSKTAKKEPETKKETKMFTGEKKVKWENGTIKATIMYKNGLREGLNKNYSPSGKLLSIAPYSNNMLNGQMKQFYSDGSLNSTIEYVNDLKHGKELWYYENGTLYQESNYVSGKLNGVQMRYYNNGSIMSRAPYKNGQPGLGLEEYKENGEPRKKPYIIVTEKDNTKTTGEYIITYKLSDNSTNTLFFAGDLTDGKYFDPDLSPIQTTNGVGKSVFTPSKGSFLMRNTNIIATTKTTMRNTYVVQKKINIAIENR